MVDYLGDMIYRENPFLGCPTRTREYLAEGIIKEYIVHQGYATETRPYDGEEVEKVSGVPIDQFVDFSDIDLLSGNIKE